MGTNVVRLRSRQSYRTVDLKPYPTGALFELARVLTPLRLDPMRKCLSNLTPIPTAKGSRRLQVVQLPDLNASEFVSESTLLAPFKPSVTEEQRLALVYAVARNEFFSPRTWVIEGLAHYAQALDIEQQHGRRAALEYLGPHLSVLVESEKDVPGEPPQALKTESFKTLTDQHRPTRNISPHPKRCGYGGCCATSLGARSLPC